MPKPVASAAETVEHIVRGTMYGPMRRTPLVLSRSPVSICHCAEPPPEPAIAPARGVRSASGPRPACASASIDATYAWPAASPMKRRSLLDDRVEVDGGVACDAGAHAQRFVFGDVTDAGA